MQDMAALAKRYAVERARWSFQPSPAFGAAGLTLGRGTVLARHAPDASGDGLADGERLTVLLSAVYGRPVSPDVARRAARAAAHWHRGDKALAHIVLAYARLPRLDEDDAFRLFLAGSLLDDGMSPRDLARGLGLTRYAPDQPRVPAGSPDGGRWTLGDAPAAVKPENIVVAVDTKTPDGHVLDEKSRRNMKKRNMTPEQIDEAVRSGPSIVAINKGTGGPEIRYVNPTTGVSVVIDTPTGLVLHVGETSYEYGEKGGDVPGAVMRPGSAAPTTSTPAPTVEAPIVEEPVIIPDFIVPP